MKGGLDRILVVLTDELYLPVDGDRYFSPGNHPVETLFPLMNLRAAGYNFDVAAPSGNLAKLEL